MKTECLIFDVGEIDFEGTLAAYKDILPDERKKKIDSLKFDSDKRLSLGVGILLEYVLKKENIKNRKIICNEYGKPSLEGNPFFFNCSHSGNLAVIAKSPHPVGIDTEIIRSVDFGVAKRFFSKREQSSLKDGIPLDFFRIWTRKESYTKLYGIGLGGIKDCEVISPSPIFDEISFFNTEYHSNLVTVCVKRGEIPDIKVITADEIADFLLKD